MRKVYALFLLLLNLSFLSAQQFQKFRFSVFANPSINWMSSDVKTVKKGSIALGYDVGLTVDRFFAEKYAFSTGISIGMLGGNLKYSDDTEFSVHDEPRTLPGGSEINYRLQYINIPTGLKFKTTEIGYFTYFAHLGLCSHINIKSIASSNDDDHTFSDDNVSENIKFFNMSYQFGAGAEYSLGESTAIVVGLTYSNGFIDITSHKTDKITSSNLALRLGVLF